jgi:plastocyanin
MTKFRDLWRFIALSICLVGCQAAACCAAEITVSVLDRDGDPVPDVAVYAGFAGDDEWQADGTNAIMDQVDQRFVPHLLVVQKGTTVDFPNSDVIAHHVYSFSKPNDFILPLYKGDAHPPVTFRYAGLVTLGCNIHDHMLAYILVVDSDAFGMTGEDGSVRLDVGDRQPESVTVWSPRINPRKENLTRSLQAGAGEAVVFELQGRLRPPYDDQQQSLQWSDY